MATTRFIDHLLEGDHASRPAASAVPQGTLYACTTHTLIYQSDGVSTWSTWFTGATGMTDPMTTRGDIIIRNASNVTDRLGRGGAGTVLSSDGTDISWQTPAAGGGSVVWLAKGTANNTSSNLDFTSFFSSSYDAYWFVGSDLFFATDNIDFGMRMGTGGGPTYDTGANYSVDGYLWRAGGAGAWGAATQTGIWLDDTGGGINSGTSTDGFSFDIKLMMPQGTNLPRVQGISTYENNFGPNRVGTMIRGSYDQTTTLTAIRFFASSGNISRGVINLYGLKNS